MRKFYLDFFQWPNMFAALWDNGMMKFIEFSVSRHFNATSSRLYWFTLKVKATISPYRENLTLILWIQSPFFDNRWISRKVLKSSKVGWYYMIKKRDCKREDLESSKKFGGGRGRRRAGSSNQNSCDVHEV